MRNNHVIVELVHEKNFILLYFYTSHRKLKKTLRSTLNTKLDLFKKVVNLSNRTFPDLNLSSLTKTYDFAHAPTSKQRSLFLWKYQVKNTF